MKKLTTLKTLPLIGLLAIGMSLPAVSMADDDKRGRGHDRVYKKHDGGKGHQREHRRIHRDSKGHRDHGRHYSKGHKHGGHKHVYNKYYNHGHKHYGHKHHGHGHKHVDHVVVHNHYDDWHDYDRLRLMLGLHFDNIDIIYRDY